MFLQTSEWDPWLKSMMADPLWGYVRGINMILWIIAISLMYIAAAIFFKRSHVKDLYPSQKAIFFGFACFFAIMGITRINFFLSYWIEPYYNLLLTIGYVFGALSFLPLIYGLEKHIITRTHFFFTIAGIITCALSAYFLFDVSESDLARTIQNIAMPVVLAGFVLLYLAMIKQSTGEIRKKVLLTFIGFVIFLAGILLDSESLFESISDPTLVMQLSPIIFSIGILIIVRFQRMD
jgi:hypothetical protein